MVCQVCQSQKEDFNDLCSTCLASYHEDCMLVDEDRDLGLICSVSRAKREESVQS